MFNRKDGKQRSGRVFSKILKPGEYVVNLVWGVATKDDVGENSLEGEDVHGNFPGANVVGLSCERASHSRLKLKHVRLSFQVNKDGGQGGAQRKRCCKQSYVSVRHHHFEVVVKLLHLVLLQLSQFLTDYLILD